ncbi:MAG: Nif3-like dinuclear metal center hexameric protein [Clostridia bacterium]|nr:Nif3-like dinuclear metal center hexameric protein [Clostridia bacterium]
MITVGDIYDYIQQKAPFETAEPWDNCGLLVGTRETAVSTVLVALDITARTVALAEELGAQLIVSHHPVIFDPLRTLTPELPVYRLAQTGIAAVCAHTNLDKAAGGVNDCLARLLGLEAVELSADGMCRMGQLPNAMSAETFARYVAARLGVAVRAHIGNAPVRTVAVCGGAGADLVLPLLCTADAVVTGEIKHHEWLTVSGGKTVIDGGHYATEVGVTEGLHTWLSEAFSDLKIVVEERRDPYQTIME